MALLDPELAGEIRDLVSGSTVPVSGAALTGLVTETLEWIAVEIGLGYAVARGQAHLLAAGAEDRLHRYRESVTAAAREGPHLGRLMAAHLPPVMVAGSDLLDRFLLAVTAMRRQGTYSLDSPLDGLNRLLSDGDTASAAAFLDLLKTAFSHSMPYSQCRHLAHVLPRSVLRFPPAKRAWQIQALTRAVSLEIGLAEPFLDGLERGLHRLDRGGLDRFVREGVERYRVDPRQGRRFFSLDSRLALETLDRLCTSVTLSEVRPELTRYLRARTGLPLSVRSMADLPGRRPPSVNGAWVLSDGESLYLPEEIDRFKDRETNLAFYKCLAKLESALYEFRTGDFDLERAMDRYGVASAASDDEAPFSDLDRFASAFPRPGLAQDLFTVFEHGRLRCALARSYPGILRQSDPLFRAEARRIWADGAGESSLARLYGMLVLNLPDGGPPDPDLQAVFTRFRGIMTADAPVEACARLVQETYGILEGRWDRRLVVPFGRRLPFGLLSAAWGDRDRSARAIKETLEKHGVTVYKSDVRAHLVENAGTLTMEALHSLMRPEAPPPRTGDDAVSPPPPAIDFSQLADLLGAGEGPAVFDEEADGPVFRHREWDCRLGDYLSGHVRVREQDLPDAGADFYRETLARYTGLVRRIRYAFELLRPQGLTLLRQWVEGDDFDYRALLDFAVDRKAGRTPSDRLYIKRVKGRRDVAVLLLVDLSRSTANPAAGGGTSVLDVEKAAIVLFCEALRTVGDAFAISGFSGTGRLGVDYYRIKDFGEEPTDGVKGRIAAMTPRRSTRMGAAIRHGTDRLAAVPAAVRILLVLGDGFPNDVDYKRRYAIEDTRKAILEAGVRQIHTRAITVNIAQETGLDDLFGPLHHNVISDVRDLPDKLLRIYSALTRT